MRTLAVRTSNTTGASPYCILADLTADPIDPRLHTPNTSTIPRSPPPSSGAESLSSILPPGTPPAVPSPSENESSGHEEMKRRKTIEFNAPPTALAPPPSPPAVPENESSVHEEMKRRKTIAERMAELGGIRFGAPPTAQTLPPSSPAVPENESSGNEEMKRRKTIAQRMAKLGGIKFGAP